MPVCIVSLGSNINKEHNIRSALSALEYRFGVLNNSSIYETAAVGFAGDSFYNVVSAFSSDLAAADIVQELKVIEAEHDRVHSAEKFSSRTLDIDLLLYGQQVIQTETVNIPHADILRYAFVLEPLVEIAATEKHPVSGISYAQLWADFDSNGLQT